MTVAELREILAHHRPDAIVILAQDHEGNGYSPVYVVEGARYVPMTTFCGHLRDADADADTVDPRELDAVVLGP